ncbi:MAG: hypothetical protein QM396_07200 [Euryarchaeota archaeon]|jgi:hypothetical protein|nr:hypothetical protein [Euryarchaeota archaeon]
MNTELITFKEINIGWEIVFEVNLTTEESSKCDLKPIKSVGDYEIKKESDKILFSCVFDAGDLNENETIDKRLDLIKVDIENLVISCLE